LKFLENVKKTPNFAIVNVVPFLTKGEHKSIH